MEELAGVGDGAHQDHSEVAQHGHILRGVWAFRVRPVKVKLVLLEGEELEHSAVKKADCEAPHFFLVALEQHLFYNLWVAEFINKPLCAMLILVDIGLEKIEHYRNLRLALGTLQYGKVAAGSELENPKFQLRHQLLINGELLINRVWDAKVL